MREIQYELEKQLIIDTVKRRGGKWRRKTPRRESIVSADEVVSELMKHPSYLISADRRVTRIIVSLENIYGQVYEQIIFEYV
jgi:hypothetical protein